MQIQINTDNNIQGGEKMVQHMNAVVSNSLNRFGDQLTRIEVHISDQNSDKKFGTDDIRCQMEARLTGLKPISVSDTAATLDQAVDGALEKLTRSLNSTLGRLGKR